MVFGTRENHEGRFLLENGLDGYIFWVLVVMGGLDLAACDASPTSVTGRKTQSRSGYCPTEPVCGLSQRAP